MKTAYLTCELKSRDLDSRLLIAARLLERNVHVVLGQQWSIVANGATMPKGVVLFKTANRIMADGLGELKTHGHKVVVMDEEVLALTNPYVTMLVTDRRALAACDLFLFQDSAHENLLREARPDVPGRIAGNARVDLMRSAPELYAREARQLQTRGRYILINTNFTLTNSIWGDIEKALKVTAAAGSIDLGTARGRAYAQDWIDTEQSNLAAMMEIIPWLVQEAKTHRIVVRPHPAERSESWQSIAGIEIAAGTTPTAWIMGADLVLHTNSTTGLEAALMMKPCLNICPKPESEFSRSYVTRHTNCTVETVEQAKGAIREFLQRDRGQIREFTNAVAFQGNAARVIAEEMDLLAPDSHKIESWGVRSRGKTATSKFTVDSQEFGTRLQAVFGALGAPLPTATQIDDSLFYLAP